MKSPKPKRCPACGSVPHGMHARIACRDCGFEWSLLDGVRADRSPRGHRLAHRSDLRALRRAQMGVTCLFILAWALALLLAG